MMKRFLFSAMLALLSGIGEFPSEPLIFADESSPELVETAQPGSGLIPVEAAAQRSKLLEAAGSDAIQVELRKLQEDVRLMRRDMHRIIELLEMRLSKVDSHADSIPDPLTPELKQSDKISPNVLRMEVRVLGPTDARVGQSIRFVISVTNTGAGILTNLRIKDTPDQNLQPEQGTLGLEKVPHTNAVLWRVGSLGPKQSLTREIVCICRTPTPSALTRVEVIADGNVREAADAQIAIFPADYDRLQHK